MWVDSAGLAGHPFSARWEEPSSPAMTVGQRWEGWRLTATLMPGPGPVRPVFPGVMAGVCVLKGDSIKKWPLAWAATGLTLAWLTRRFSSPALPDPGPLPASVPIPRAEPPGDMELIAVPTGVNNRVAAYAYRGGSVFDRRDFYIGAALVKHPQGDLLVDAGFGRDIARQFSTMPCWCGYPAVQHALRPVAIRPVLLNTRYQAKVTTRLAPYHVPQPVMQTILGSIGGAPGIAAYTGGLLGAELGGLARSLHQRDGPRPGDGSCRRPQPGASSPWPRYLPDASSPVPRLVVARRANGPNRILFRTARSES